MKVWSIGPVGGQPIEQNLDPTKQIGFKSYCENLTKYLDKKIDPVIGR